jgi:hypothetical protein
VLQNKTKETWYWGESEFKKHNPLLKYDFDDNKTALFFYLCGSKTAELIWLTFVFAIISMINALFIRVSIKCSVLMIFPMISLQNRFSARRVGHAQ